MENPPPPPPESDDPLKSTTTVLTTLINHHIPLTHHFKLKWSLINTKLTSLLSHLTDLPPSPSPSPLLTTLLTSLSATLTTALSLSSACSSPSTPPSGKLLTQSQLDSLSSSLDRHSHDLDILLRSGLLESTHSPTPRDAARATARDLLTRLQIGSPESKSSAVDSLLSFLHSDDKNVVIAVAQGVLPVLVSSLDSPILREKAVSAIARVSSIESSSSALMAEGLVLMNQLLKIVETGSVNGREKACVVLQRLSVSKDNARAMGSRGGVLALLEVCVGGTPSSQAMAAGVLRNLAKFDEVKESFEEENAIPVLIGVLESGTLMARENVAGCLSNLVDGDEAMKVVLVREGGVEGLRSYWDSVPVGLGLEPAVEMVKNLGSYPPICEVLVSEGLGFHLRVLPLLDCGVLAVRIAAAGAVYELGLSSRARREMGEEGCVSALVKMLDGKAVEEREAAAKALSRLLLCGCNRKIFNKEERGIVGTVQLLDPLGSGLLDRKWAVAVLGSLASSKKCRKKMVGAGACVYLHKLVELEVEGAKKLLVSLGRGKLWGVFARP